MKTMKFPALSALLFSCLISGAQAQTYSINWYSIAGGGGTSSGAPYAISGTIGQPDASGSMSGGPYSVTGGFWSLISTVQTPGLPTLSVIYIGKTAVISWPATGTYTLQQNNNLSNPSGWATSSYTVSASNGTNSISIASPSGSLFFRLSSP